MSRAKLDTWINLDNIHCYDEADGIGNAEPYLWPVFFKVDGSTVQVNPSTFNLQGKATVVATNGAHGNLGTTDVDAGDDVPVPESVGSFHTELVPIPLEGTSIDVAGVAGVITVLMEEDNLSDAGALAGYQALVSTFTQNLNALIPQLGLKHQEITDDDVKALQKGISDAITSAVVNAQSGLQNFWTWLNPDDQIGFEHFEFSHDQLASNLSLDFSHRWKNEGDWEIFGHAHAVAKCPAQAMMKISESMGNSQMLDLKQMDVLRAFRDKTVRCNPTLSAWWSMAERNSAALSRLVIEDRAAREAMFAALPALSALIARPDTPWPDTVVKQALVVLDCATRSPSSQLRSDAARAHELIELLPSHTLDEVVAIASAVKPSRSTRRSDVPGLVRTALAGMKRPLPPRPVHPQIRSAG